VADLYWAHGFTTPPPPDVGREVNVQRRKRASWSTLVDHVQHSGERDDPLPHDLMATKRNPATERQRLEARLADSRVG
jgi:hypothetical protein